LVQRTLELTASKVDLEVRVDERTAELVSLNKKLSAAKDLAIGASRFKSQFLANMSHEIRTPMNGILGMTEVLLRGGLNEKERGYANTILDAGKSLLSVINDILDFSKIEAGKLNLEIVEFGPIRLVESVADLLAAQAKKRNLSLLTFIDPEIPDVLRGDLGRLRQILMNFSGNAIKFAEEGKVLIRASKEESSAGKVWVKFSVTDNGIGLTPEEIAQLFQPFVQIDGTRVSTFGGTGLGLSISKRLVDLMGGEIGVTSLKDHGSTFWFSVPLEIGVTEYSAPRKIQDLTSTRVLVVDDEESARDILQEYLTSWGMRKETAKNAKEGLALLHAAAEKNEPYDVAIIDMVMLGTNGLQLGKTILENEVLKSTKLILITAYDKPVLGEEAIGLGFDAYLTKPIKQSQLLDAIASVMQEARLEEGLGLADPATDQKPFLQNPNRDELILVAEDHPINQEVALLLLKDLGFEAHVAKNGKLALDMMQRIPYALVFMDCQMPELNGYDTTRAFRKIETRTGKHIPIIAMTAHAIEGSREQCIAAGMDDYISKPFDPDHLNQMIEKWIVTDALARSANGAIEQTGPPGAHGKALPITINLEQLRAKYGINTERILDLFLKDAPTLIEQIGIALNSSDEAELLKSTHSLQGVCATVRALSLKQVCREIESAVEISDWQSAHALLKHLESQFQAVQRFLAIESTK
jgi:two-component system sensor histidine kinase/response regulator